MRKKLLLSIGFSLGATALTAVTVGWMGRPQEQALLSPLNESERAGVLEAIRAEKPSRQKSKAIQQILEMLEEQDSERTAWREMQALRTDLDRAREQLRDAEWQHSVAMRQMRSEYSSLRSERDEQASKIAQLERMVNLLGAEVRERMAELEQAQLAFNQKEATLSKSLAEFQGRDRRHADRIASLMQELASAERQLASHHSAAQQAESALQELKAKHSSLAVIHAQTADELALARREKNALAGQVWLAQEALSNIRDERNGLEHEVLQLRQTQLAQRKDLDVLQASLAEALAARGQIQRQVKQAQNVLDSADPILASQDAGSRAGRLKQFLDQHLAAELEPSDNALMPDITPIRDALRNALASMREAGEELHGVLAYKQEMDSALAERDQQLQVLKDKLEATTELQQRLRHLAQQHLAIVAKISQPLQTAGGKVHLASRRASRVDYAEQLQGWLEQAAESVAMVEQVLQKGAQSSKVQSLKADLNQLVRTDQGDVKSLAACCGRWSEDLCGLCEDLECSIEEQKRFIESESLARKEAKKITTKASQQLARASERFQHRLARARSQVALAHNEEQETGRTVATLSVAALQGAGASAQTNERLLELEIQLAAKTAACQELSERVENLERHIAERHDSLRAMADHVVSLEQEREGETLENLSLQHLWKQKEKELLEARLELMEFGALKDREVAQARAEAETLLMQAHREAQLDLQEAQSEAQKALQQKDHELLLAQQRAQELIQSKEQQWAASEQQLAAVVQQKEQELRELKAQAMHQIAEANQREAQVRRNHEALAKVHEGEWKALKNLESGWDAQFVERVAAIEAVNTSLREQLEKWQAQYLEVARELEHRKQDWERSSAQLAELETDHANRQQALVQLRELQQQTASAGADLSYAGAKAGAPVPSPDLPIAVPAQGALAASSTQATELLQSVEAEKQRLESALRQRREHAESLQAEFARERASLEQTIAQRTQEIVELQAAAERAKAALAHVIADTANRQQGQEELLASTKREIESLRAQWEQERQALLAQVAKLEARSDGGATWSRDSSESLVGTQETSQSRAQQLDDLASLQSHLQEQKRALVAKLAERESAAVHLEGRRAQAEQALTKLQTETLVEKEALTAMVGARQAELVVLQHQLQEAQGALAALQTRHDAEVLELQQQLEGERSALQDVILSRNESILELKLELETEQQALAQLRSEVESKREALRVAESKIGALQEEKQQALAWLEQRSQEVGSLQAGRDEALAEAKNLSTALAQAESVVAQQKDENQALQHQLEHLIGMRLDVKLASSREEILGLKQELQGQQQRMEQVARDGLELQTELARVGQSLAVALSDKALLQNQLDETVAHLESARRQATELESVRQDLAARLQSWEERQVERLLQESAQRLIAMKQAMEEAGATYAVELAAHDQLRHEHERMKQAYEAEIVQLTQLRQQQEQEAAKALALVQSANDDLREQVSVWQSRFHDTETVVADQKRRLEESQKLLEQIESTYAAREASWTMLSQEAQRDLQVKSEELAELQLLLQHERSSLQETIITRSSEVASLQAELRQARDALGELRESFISHQQMLAHSESEVRGLQAEKRELDTLFSQSRQTMLLHADELELARVQAAETADELAKTRGLLAQAQHQQEALSMQIEHLTSLRMDMRLSESNRELAEARQALQSVVADRARLETELNRLNEMKLEEQLVLSDQAAQRIHDELQKALQEQSLLRQQLQQQLALNLESRLAEATGELHSWQRAFHDKAEELAAAAMRGLTLEHRLQDAESQLAQVLADRSALSATTERQGAALAQAEAAAALALQERDQLASRLKEWEQQELEHRLSSATAEIERLGAALQEALAGRQTQAQRVRELEEILVRKQQEDEEIAAHHQRIIDKLKEELSSMQTMWKELLAEKTQRDEHILDLESGLAVSQAEAAEAKSRLQGLYQEYAALRAANWEGRALQLEGQSQVLLAGQAALEEKFAEMEQQGLSLQLEKVSLEHALTQVEREAAEQQEALEAQLQALKLAYQERAFDFQNQIAQQQDRLRQAELAYDEQQQRIALSLSEQIQAEQQLHDRLAHQNLRMAELEQQLQDEQQQLALARASSEQKDVLISTLRQDAVALEQALQDQLSLDLAQRLALATRQLEHAQMQLETAQQDRDMRISQVDELEQQLRLAVARQQEAHEELTARFQQQIAAIEQQSQQELVALREHVGQLQQTLGQTESVKSESLRRAEQLSQQLAGLQGRLDEVTAQREQEDLIRTQEERLRHQETQSLMEKAAGIEGHYQQMMVQLRTEQDHQLVRVSELEHEVVLRDSAMQNQLKSLERAHKILEETRQQSSELASALKKVEAELACSQQEAASANSLAQSLRLLLDQRETTLASLTRQADEQAELIARAERNRAELEHALVVARQRSSTHQEARGGLDEGMQTELEQLRDELKQLRSDLQKRDAERQELRSELLSAQEQLSHLSKARRDWQHSAGDTQQRANGLQQQLDRLQVQLRDRQAAAEDKDQQILLLQQELDHRQTLLDEEDVKHRALEKALVQERNQVALLESRLSALTNPELAIESPALEQGRFHLVRQGETLRDIAKRYYGDYREAFRLRTANVRTLGNRDEPTPGSLLVIP